MIMGLNDVAMIKAKPPLCQGKNLSCFIKNVIFIYVFIIL